MRCVCHACYNKTSTRIRIAKPFPVSSALILLTYLLASVKTAIGPYPMQGQVRAFYHSQIRR